MYLRRPVPPALPLSGEEFSRLYQDQFNNVLRLYFNQLSNTVNSMAGVNGGQYIECPNGLFFNTVDQTFAAPDTMYPIVYNATYLSNAVALKTGSTSQIQVSVPGIYNFQYTGQLRGTNASSKSFFIWISRNGTDIGYSTRAFTSTLNNEYKQVSWNFNIDLDTDEYVELRVSTTDTTILLDAETGVSPHPGIPSSVLTVNYISPLPETRPTPPAV